MHSHVSCELVWKHSDVLWNAKESREGLVDRQCLGSVTSHESSTWIFTICEVSLGESSRNKGLESPHAHVYWWVTLGTDHNRLEECLASDLRCKGGARISLCVVARWMSGGKVCCGGLLNWWCSWLLRLLYVVFMFAEENFGRCLRKFSVDFYL